MRDLNPSGPATNSSMPTARGLLATGLLLAAFPAALWAATEPAALAALAGLAAGATATRHL